MTGGGIELNKNSSNQSDWGALLYSDEEFHRLYELTDGFNDTTGDNLLQGITKIFSN